MYRARWVVVAVWVGIFAVSLYFAPRVTSVLRGGGYNLGTSQSTAAFSSLNHAYGYRALTFTVVFRAPADDRARAVRDARVFRRAAAARFGKTLSISAPRTSPDGAIVFERVYSMPLEDFGTSYADRLRALFPGPPVRTYLTGPAAIFHDMEAVSEQDLRSIEVVTLPLAAVVLLLIFGSPLAAAVPVLMAPVAVTLALAAITFIGQRVTMSIFVLNTASMLGLGVAIDYSLFLVNRFREELRRGQDLETAVGRTVATSGRAILVSAVVVSAGFFSLMLMGVDMLRSIGIGGGIVTVFSLLVALTFLPAILGILGNRIDLLHIFPRQSKVSGLWGRIGRAVMARPVIVIAGVSAVILILVSPAFHLRVGIPGPEILPSSVDSRAGNDLLQAHLGYANNQPVLVVVERKPGTPVSTTQSTGFAVLDRVCSSSNVAGIALVPVPDSPRQIRSCTDLLNSATSASPAARARLLRTARRQRVALLSVILRTNASSAASERYVQMLRHAPPIPGYDILVGGQTGGQIDFNNFLYARFPLVIAVVVLMIYSVLLIAFRSVLLPLKAVLMNVFSILAAYGVVVWGFQDGHLSQGLSFTVVGNIDSIVPVFLFCVLFGISTDYEVFLLSRVQESYLATGDNEDSVAHGLAVTGRIITSAAAIMIVVFVAFGFARLVVVKELGVGLAAAVLIDATLIRVLLVPATMRLLGRWNWWLPGRGFPRAGPPEEPVQQERAAV